MKVFQKFPICLIQQEKTTKNRKKQKKNSNLLKTICYIILKLKNNEFTEISTSSDIF